MFNFLTKPFRKPTLNEIVSRDVDEAQRSLLAHETLAEYHAGLASVCRQRIARLNTLSEKGIR